MFYHSQLNTYCRPIVCCTENRLMLTILSAYLFCLFVIIGDVDVDVNHFINTEALSSGHEFLCRNFHGNEGDDQVRRNQCDVGPRSEHQASMIFESRDLASTKINFIPVKFIERKSLLAMMATTIEEILPMLICTVADTLIISLEKS